MSLALPDPPSPFKLLFFVHNLLHLQLTTYQEVSLYFFVARPTVHPIHMPPTVHLVLTSVLLVWEKWLVKRLNQLVCTFLAWWAGSRYQFTHIMLHVHLSLVWNGKASLHSTKVLVFRMSENHWLFLCRWSVIQMNWPGKSECGFQISFSIFRTFLLLVIFFYFFFQNCWAMNMYSLLPV
jgi:hypothetical protein